MIRKSKIYAELRVLFYLNTTRSFIPLLSYGDTFSAQCSQKKSYILAEGLFKCVYDLLVDLFKLRGLYAIR